MTPQEIYRHIKLGMSEDQAVQLINDPSISYDQLNAPTDNKVKIRDVAFRAEVFSFQSKYSVTMLAEFHEYWSETNRSGTKMRFEMEKTWSLDKRLVRWANNNFKSSSAPPVTQRKKGTFL